MKDVAIVGVGIHPFGRYPDRKGKGPVKSFYDMGRYAVKEALKDANVEFKDIGATYCSHMHGPTAAGHTILAHFGINGMPIVNIENACAGGGTCLKMAADAIRSGMTDVALALGVEKMPHGFIEMNVWPHWMELMGINITPFAFATRARRHMEEFGVTAEHFAKVSVKNHRHGTLNPYAMYQKEVTLEEVMNSPIVADPLRILMLCAPNEGAAAAILCRADKAHKYTNKPVYVAATAVGTPIEGSIFGGVVLPEIHGIAYMDKPVEITTFVSKKAYEEAGIGPENLDCVELQDTDAASEIAESELLGICPMGEGARLIDEGTTTLGSSKRPIVNVSGGLLSKGEPVGASGLAQVAEICWQLRGDAGPRQIENAKVGLGHTIGMGGNCSVVILER